MSKQQKAIYEQRLYQLQNSMKRMKEPKENDIVDGVNKAFKEFENIINQVNKMNSVENGPSLADSKSLKIWTRVIVDAPICELILGH